MQHTPSADVTVRVGTEAATILEVADDGRA